MTALELAINYTRRGWSVIPIPFRSKNPGVTGWQTLRLTEADLGQHFNGHPQNIGVQLGEASKWLIDIDLDHLACIVGADRFLPPTAAVFGRASKPRSHRLYYVTRPVKTRRISSKRAGMLLELRSTRLQTVLPGSTHESGEPIEWEDPNAEPATVDPEQLLAAVEALGAAVKAELGEAATPKPVEAVQKSGGSPNADRIQSSLAAMARIKMQDHSDGSKRLFTAACRCVEHDLGDPDALNAIRTYARRRPFPEEWSDAQILARLRDAERTAKRGAALQATEDDEGCMVLGTRDPKTGRLVLSPRKTLPTAIAFCDEFYLHDGTRTLHDYAGTLLAWRNNRYAQVEEGAIRQQMQPWLHDALRYTLNKRSGELELTGFDSNPTTVNAALESVRSLVHLPAHVTPPAWLADDAPHAALSPTDLLPFPAGTLHVPSGEVIAPTPLLFNTNAIDFAYDRHAEPPERWIAFLEQLWGDDLESVELLQEWMGYCLVADTSQQKMLLMVGPRRSGKGTTGRVIRRLVGEMNVAGPTTSSLAGAFGLQPLIGKSLAIVSDARFGGENIGTVVERLLCISGEDTLTVDRKFLSSVTMKLAIRFMFLTNELPRMNDASAALAGRFVILRLVNSFYGQEDTQLFEKLAPELPGILLWAIEGLKRLRARGHFFQPTSVAEAVQEMEDLASPVLAFVRERCTVSVGQRTWVDELYEAWKAWCASDGRTTVTSKQVFGRDLSAAAPGVVCRRHSVQGRFYDGIALNVGGVP